VCCDYVERSRGCAGRGCVPSESSPVVPPTVNQSYKIVNIRGVSRLALSEEVLEYQEEIAILAFQALTKEFRVINGTGGREYTLELL